MQAPPNEEAYPIRGSRIAARPVSALPSPQARDYGLRRERRIHDQEHVRAAQRHNRHKVAQEPRPDPSRTLWFPRAGLNSSTISRFELKPPVATTTALLLTATGSPVLALQPSRPVTRPPLSLSAVISVSGMISPPFLRKLSRR